MTAEPTAAPLRLGGVPEHFNYPWHLAIGTRFPDGDGPDRARPGAVDGLAVTWTDQPGGTGEILEHLETGELDVASVLTEGSVAAMARGLDIVLVQVYVSSPLQWGVFVPARSDLTTEESLVDAPIVISRFGSGSHLMAYVLAERHGWTIEDDRFVVAGNLDGARAAFAAGGDQVFLWDRFMTRPLVDAGEFRQVGVLPTPWPPFVIAATREALTGRTTEVGRVVDAVVAAAVGLPRRPGAVDELADRYGLDRSTAQEWLGTTTFAPRGPIDLKVPAAVLDTLAAAGLGSTG
ncbi:MAG: ABC transporter substrate-binding protein [Acidimicrobiales bacterium]